jgi:transcriptional regulator with XRE-family HTH domain
MASSPLQSPVAPIPRASSPSPAVASLVARAIQRQRLTRGMSQQVMARHLGIGQQAYSKYETARRRIPLCNLIKICQALDLNITEILALYATTTHTQEVSDAHG